MNTILIISLCSLCIILSILSIIIGTYYYKINNTNSPWKCINNRGNNYIISRINKGQSECMYNIGGDVSC